MALKSVKIWDLILRSCILGKFIFWIIVIISVVCLLNNQNNKTSEDTNSASNLTATDFISLASDPNSKSHFLTNMCKYDGTDETTCIDEVSQFLRNRKAKLYNSDMSKLEYKYMKNCQTIEAEEYPDLYADNPEKAKNACDILIGGVLFELNDYNPIQVDNTNTESSTILEDKKKLIEGINWINDPFYLTTFKEYIRLSGQSIISPDVDILSFFYNKPQINTKFDEFMDSITHDNSMDNIEKYDNQLVVINNKDVIILKYETNDNEISQKKEYSFYVKARKHNNITTWLRFNELSIKFHNHNNKNILNHYFSSELENGLNEFINSTQQTYVFSEPLVCNSQKEFGYIGFKNCINLSMVKKMVDAIKIQYKFELSIKKLNLTPTDIINNTANINDIKVLDECISDWNYYQNESACDSALEDIVAHRPTTH